MKEIQNTLGWYKQRLGKFTSSKISDLMTSGKKKDEMWGDTAKSYMESIAAERMLRDDVKGNDDLFEKYVEYMDGSSKYTEWGHLCEPKARKAFSEAYGVEIYETDCIDHPSIDFLAGSPDGIIEGDAGSVDAVIEIKCPKPDTFVKYASRVKTAEDLKKVKKEYYWQCINNMFVTGAKKCYFIVYCPWLQEKMYVIEIPADEDAFKQIEERVNAANEEVDNIIATFLFGDEERDSPDSSSFSDLDG